MITPAEGSARRRSPWIFGVATVVALSGCSADTSVPAPAESAELTPAPSQPGPLEELIGFGGSIDSAQDFVADEAWREGLTAQCMADLGFDYEPINTDRDSIVFSEGPLFGTREYVEVYGYGVWNPPRDEGGSMSASYTDPNTKRIEAMSEAELTAYNLALRGEATPMDDGAISYAGGGCSDASIMPVDDDTRYLLSIREDAVRFLDDLLNDPAFSEVDAAWASCMAEAGYQERSPIAARYRVMDQHSAETDGGGDTPENPARVEEEIRIATADLDCQEATGWQEKHTAIEHSLQQDYLDDHQAELDELVAVVGTGERPS